MNKVSGIESAEELRELLFALRQDYSSLVTTSSQTQLLLDALDSLLGLGISDDPFVRAFASLESVFSYDRALMLAKAPGAAGSSAQALSCIAADPACAVGSMWPVASLFRKVMSGRVVATFSNAGIDEWQGSHRAAISGDSSALYVPVASRDRHGILMLLRNPDNKGFDRGDIALARRFSVLVSHALASRDASETAAEGHRLRELTEQLQQSEQLAHRNASLLQELVSVLPVGVAVQDEDGRLLIANDVAATLFGKPVSDLVGTIPFAERVNDEKALIRRQDRHKASMAENEQWSREQQLSLDGEERTLLVTGKSVRIHNESLLLTASLDISERKQFEEELSHRAFHDQLTGLPNRALMQQLVESALRAHRNSGQFALAFIDLDKFKQINDFYSHSIGDGLLKAIAARIVENIRPGDTLARISGDEFLLLIDPLDDHNALTVLMDRILKALKEPFVVDGHEMLTSASVGASIYPLHGDSYEGLRRCADSAMYRAKSNRSGGVTYFDESMSSTLTAQMELEQRLRVAIREQRFKMAFQPKVRLACGRVTGFEALIRWVEEDGTVLMPGVFIELASELGLLDELTRIALQDVAHNFPELSRRFGDHTTVSINVGAVQAGDVEFMQAFAKEIARTGYANRIILELTEEALVATARFQHRVLPALRSIGVRVSIDDFGTGYSSLSTLADITADEVKVDRAFITSIHERPRSQGILKAIDSLCSALGIEMVAEGVETPEEMAYLRSSTGIAVAQGYYFAKPCFIDVLDLPAPALPGESTLFDVAL